ncbi:MAG TPA: hypothetical protein VHW74_15725 [Mycobacteriales bacterium]|nr:hypothetical protein [Mycobacteriales bacterium]
MTEWSRARRTFGGPHVSPGTTLLGNGLGRNGGPAGGQCVGLASGPAARRASRQSHPGIDSLPDYYPGFVRWQLTTDIR